MGIHTQKVFNKNVDIHFLYNFIFPVYNRAHQQQSSIITTQNNVGEEQTGAKNSRLTLPVTFDKDKEAKQLNSHKTNAKQAKQREEKQRKVK